MWKFIRDFVIFIILITIAIFVFFESGSTDHEGTAVASFTLLYVLIFGIPAAFVFSLLCVLWRFIRARPKDPVRRI